MKISTLPDLLGKFSLCFQLDNHCFSHAKTLHARWYPTVRCGLEKGLPDLDFCGPVIYRASEGAIFSNMSGMQGRISTYRIWPPS